MNKFSEIPCRECYDQINELKVINEQTRNQIKALKDQYIEALAKNFQLDYVLAQLESQLKPSDTRADTENTEITENTPDALLNQFFTESELEEFQLIGNEVSRDSTFVLAVVRKLYANDLSLVKKKSACGRHKNKESLTPEKSNVLLKLFQRRLKSCQSTDIDSRLGKFTKHINSAFSNISKSLKD